ncbi:MAG: ABC transporter permease [Candidatus Didemnitutus sp.]|nr:ABC transporter permease [Candidatus Didemnitutus sp.]
MFLENFLQDLRVGLRVLVKEKSFCALAVFVLALGISAVTTQFSVVNGALLRGFKFPNAEQLVDVQLADPTNFTPANFNSRMTTMDFADIKASELKSFSAFAGYLNGSTINLTYAGQARRLQGGYVTHDFFRTLGVAPVLGRDFLPEEDQPGAAKAVILSDALWRSDFGADPEILNKAVRVNGRSGTVIGVMPPKFAFPANEQLWVPVNTEFPPRPRNDRSINFISVIARLKPGVSIAQASNEIGLLAQRFADAYPDTNKQFSMGFVRPLIKAFTGGQLSGLLYTMLAFCVGVLVMACVNVMNMQFARATLRSKELAIRSALGAGRFRLICQMLTESLLIATLGAVLGVGLAYWATDMLDATARNLSNPIPSWISFEIDFSVLLFTVGATLIAALISGLLPAWLSSRADAGEVLKESGRGNTGRAIGYITSGLVVLQILLTCFLLIGALLQVQSITKQQNIDYGYDAGSLVGARIGLMEGDYPTSDDRKLAYERLLRELRATPEFASAALTTRFRMVFSGGSPIEIEGKSYAVDSDRTIAQTENISAGYHTVLGQKLISGREFTDEDNDQREPVAVVNAFFAKKHFGNENPLGRRFRTTAPNGNNPSPWRTIVGVVTDVRMLGPFNNQQDNAGFYVPLFASAFGPTGPTALAAQFMTVIAKPRGGQRGEAAAQAVRNVIKKVDANLPPYFVETPKTSFDGFLGQNRIVATMFGIFGIVAVVLAATGLYGVMSFAVNQRTQEFGIRMALGADSQRVMRMVLGQGTRQLVIGLTSGLGLTLTIALLADSTIQNFLFGISPTDPLTYIVVASLLTVVSLFAVWVPAKRATRVDPMIALRAE